MKVARQEATRRLINPYSSITYQSLSTRMLCNLCLAGKCNSRVIVDFAKIARGGEKYRLRSGALGGFELVKCPASGDLKMRGWGRQNSNPVFPLI